MADEDTISDVFENVRRRASEAKRNPVSTYRVQFNHNFTFRDAAALVPYLHELGITDIYASPYLKARPGSMHGYDITDHNSLNPEIGSEEDYRSFVARLHKHGMGQILDFVPNHMSIIDNPWWMDVMENGLSSPFAEFFDIDWYPAKAELYEKVLLPILEDQYGKVLEAGLLRLDFLNGAFYIKYGEHTLPIGPRTAALPLEDCLARVRETLGEGHADFLEMQSIITASHNLPARHETTQERTSERLREKEIIKKRLWELHQKNEKVRVSLAETVDAFNGKVGVSRSFDRLHELLDQQVYRLSYWRVALDEINYRRFFDNNELAAIRTESRRVFNLSHKLLKQLLRERAVTGLRIDHVDGLFDPSEYLWRLQKARFLGLCRDELETARPAVDQPDFEEKLLEKYDEELRLNPDSAIVHPLYIVVEKILGEKERLRGTWPVDGTTGYEFANLLDGIFVNRRNVRALRNIYCWFTKTDEDFRDIAYYCKDLIMRTSMSAETNVAALRLDRVAEKSRWYRDFTLNSLRDTIREVIACFPVYRTYINASGNPVSDEDKTVISAAISQARRRNPALSGSLFDYLRDTLLLKYAPDLDEEGRREQQQFVMHFQQLTGPIMAKGVEDTAFYRYNPIVSSNDVGGNPARLGNTVREFHLHNAIRHRAFKHSLLATSTHDSKRSEDVRARINVLSEMPGKWKTARVRWSRLNRRKKITLNEERVPDRNEEFLIYQTLIGTYPIEEMDEAERQKCADRIQTYILKAIREAKVHTSWVSPDTAYEEGVAAFIAAILDPSPSNTFLVDFIGFNKQVSCGGMYNSLSQVVLKAFSPGTPDLYQGNELWNFSLVDPDNRGQVDFTLRIKTLEVLKERAAKSENLSKLTEELLSNISDGRVKLYVTWKALNYRRENSDLFNEGTYVPLEAAGGRKTNICAFAWRMGSKQIAVVAPRLVAKFTQNGAVPPVGRQVWGDTVLQLPGRARIMPYRNIFTGELIQSAANGRRVVLPVAQVLATFPIAALELVSD
ncbi:MAG: malto-oligosyltrehalose synthase [Chloroflexi bacterium]|nr:malto-oligosyltrehalose synthase [Chloroflexota bacterium]